MPPSLKSGTRRPVTGLNEIRRGEIWNVALDPTVGSEIRKSRPCVVVQRDAANATSPATIVCPITDARGRKVGLISVLLQSGEGGLTKDSVVLCNQVRTVDRLRFRKRIGSIPPTSMDAIGAGLAAMLDL